MTDTAVLGSAVAAQTSMHKSVKLERRIGSTTYKINVYASPNAKVEMGRKLLRLIERKVQADD